MRIKLSTGFTLVEAMVAVTVLTLAISGAFFTANSAIIAAEIASDQLTASYLAQEGVEYVRKMRDDAYLAAVAGGNPANAWSTFLAELESIAPPVLKSDDIPASFERTIQVFSASETDERIISKVSWSFHGTIYSVTVTDHLTPWQ